MVDGDRVFTVMNGRSQGGSALAPGNIELMQNRRIPADDDRGMGEYLDEKDSYGNGIRVPATYYVQIFEKSKTADNQRQVQKQKYFEPAQYFFNFDMKVSGTGKASPFSENLKAAGIKNLVDFVTIPLDKNKMLIRLENLSEQQEQVDLISVASAFNVVTP